LFLVSSHAHFYRIFYLLVSGLVLEPLTMGWTFLLGGIHRFRLFIPFLSVRFGQSPHFAKSQCLASVHPAIFLLARNRASYVHIRKHAIAIFMSGGDCVSPTLGPQVLSHSFFLSNHTASQDSRQPFFYRHGTMFATFF